MTRIIEGAIKKEIFVIMHSGRPNLTIYDNEHSKRTQEEKKTYLLLSYARYVFIIFVKAPFQTMKIILI